MSLIKHVVVICLTSLLVQSEASRILAVLPTPSISHQVAFRPLILELVKRGHEVVMLTTDPIYKKGEGIANLTEIDVHDISYNLWKKELVNKENVSTGKRSDLKAQIKIFMEIIDVVFLKQMETDEMQSILKDKTRTFDLLLLEAWAAPLLALTHIFKNVPVIQISSLGAENHNLNPMGVPVHPLLYPTIFQQQFNDLTVWDKLRELYLFYWVESYLSTYMDNLTQFLRAKIDKTMPSMRELERNVDFFLLNIHPMWALNCPHPPNVIFMGGIHQKPQKELPQDLKNYLDSSKNGVVYVSFGTNVEPTLFAPEKLQAIINAFSKLPYDVLWKWNTDEFPGKPDNIKISKWLPQSDLLRHPKIKLFITQGGLQSTDESISAGVPLIAIPIFADQWFNSEHYIKHKIGLALLMDNISEEKVLNAINKVVNDTSYRENVLRLRNIMHDQPETSLERATWWTEYVIRHKGAKHLKAPGAHMSLAQYLELELVAYILIFLSLTISILGYAIYYLCTACYRVRFVSKKIKNT